jgi:hypothetical protein
MALFRVTHQHQAKGHSLLLCRQPYIDTAELIRTTKCLNFLFSWNSDLNMSGTQTVTPYAFESECPKLVGHYRRPPALRTSPVGDPMEVRCLTVIL